MSCYVRMGDSQQLIKTVAENSIDLIFISPPFNGATQNEWDTNIEWPLMFAEFFRILKPTGMLVLFTAIPFNYTVIRSAPKPPHYTWYWNKMITTNPLIANIQPLRCVEEILVWKKQHATFYRQFTGTEKRTVKYMTHTEYYGTVKPGEHTVNGKSITHLLEMPRHPDTVGGRPKKGKKRVRNYITRSEEMIELFYRLYTKEGDTILDCFCHKGLTGVVAKRMNRKYIGFDKLYYPELLLI